MKESSIILALILLASCARETGTDAPVSPAGETVRLSAVIPESKTGLGEKNGNSYPNYWFEGDVVSVNGVDSTPIAAEFAGTRKADIDVVGVNAPYYAACPAGAVSGYGNGSTSISIPSEELIDGVAMSESSFPSSSQGALDAIFDAADAVTTVSEADALDGTSFCSAYTRLIKMIQTRRPSAKIVCVIGDYLRGGQGDAIKLIAAHFGEDKVRVADLLGDGVSIPKYSNPHPNAAGMTNMADYIYSKVGAWIDEN